MISRNCRVIKLPYDCPDYPLKCFLNIISEEVTAENISDVTFISVVKCTVHSRNTGTLDTIVEKQKIDYVCINFQVYIDDDHADDYLEILKSWQIYAQTLIVMVCHV